MTLRSLHPQLPRSHHAFGHSVAGIQDVNEDGLGDILIEAPGEESAYGLYEGGRVYLLTAGDPPFEGPSSVENSRLVE